MAKTEAMNVAETTAIAITIPFTTAATLTNCYCDCCCDYLNDFG